jgi:hypothetical protein
MGRWSTALLPVQLDWPEWAPTLAIWLPIMQNERELELGRYYGPYNGQYNVSGRRVYWRWHDINTVLREHRYRPEYRAMPPARGPPLTLRRRAVPAESSSKRATSGILRYRHA